MTDTANTGPAVSQIAPLPTSTQEDDETTSHLADVVAVESSTCPDDRFYGVPKCPENKKPT